jgi:hypothetical protein
LDYIARAFSEKHKVEIPTKVRGIIETALKIRMVAIARNSAWFALRRYRGDRPERVYFDVPMARFALLKAENVITGNGMGALEMPKEELPAAIEDLRNEAVAAVSHESGSGRRDEGGGEKGNLGVLVELTETQKMEKKLRVVDIMAFVEIDARMDSALVFCQKFG